MGKIFIKNFDHTELNKDTIYVCKNCECHLSLSSKIISRHFRGKTGEAYLFHNCINVIKHNPERRELSTGFHTVADISCINCNKYLGWYYYDAENPTEEYKIDKYILECDLVSSVKPEASPSMRRIRNVIEQAQRLGISQRSSVLIV